MPIYEYECQKCGHRLEALQRMNDRPLRSCPECKGRLKRLLSAPAFQFKGSGWYVTDYARKEGGAEASGSEGSSGADSKASGGDKKGDSKSDGGGKKSKKKKAEASS